MAASRRIKTLFQTALFSEDTLVTRRNAPVGPGPGGGIDAAKSTQLALALARG
jgi:hypothetical protein